MFLFDPTQDPRFRNRYGATSSNDAKDVTNRQESVLLETATRVRRYLSLAQSAKHDRPLIVVLTKADAWGHLLTGIEPVEPWHRKGEVAGLDMERVETASWAARALLAETCPEVVTAAEDFASRVIYVPVSALGRTPEPDPTNGRPTIRPRDIKPRWVMTPLLVGLREGLPGLISRLKHRSHSSFGNGSPQSSGGIPRGRLA
jgi:hypothetical protein